MSVTPDSNLPCLLDRITGIGGGPLPAGNGMSLGDYHACVLRDLRWLLNSSQYPRLNPADPFDDSAESASPHDRDNQLRTDENPRGYLYPWVRKSVLNYGFRSLAGTLSEGMDMVELERELRDAIITFEPRFVSRSVSVKFVSEKAGSGRLAFDISAQLWALSRAEPVRFRSEFDLESGGCSIKESQ